MATVLVIPMMCQGSAASPLKTIVCCTSIHCESNPSILYLAFTRATSSDSWELEDVNQTGYHRPASFIQAVLPDVLQRSGLSSPTSIHIREHTLVWCLLASVAQQRVSSRSIHINLPSFAETDVDYRCQQVFRVIALVPIEHFDTLETFPSEIHAAPHTSNLVPTPNSNPVSVPQSVLPKYLVCLFCFGDDSHWRDARHSHPCEDRRDAETAR